MSKKAQVKVKKSRRRLKRSIRRSLAAVLMITAIGVAAIPVPENAAATEDMTDIADMVENGIVPLADNGKEDPHKDYTYPTASGQHDGEGQKDEEKDKNIVLDKHLIKTNPQETEADYAFVNTDNSIDITKLKNVLYDRENKSGSIYQSLMISDLGNDKWDLGWEFMYYEVSHPTSGETQGVICKYNNQYTADKVNLEVTPNTEYYTVTEEKYDNYFKGTGDSREGMKDMDLDPTKDLSFTYDIWSHKTISSDEWIFFEKYDEEAFKAKVADFEKYDPDNPDESLITALTGKPADILRNSDRKYEFYCDHDEELRKYGSGYKLVPVIDSRMATGEGSSGGDATGILVARGGTPTPSPLFGNDGNGFLFTNVGVKACAIGERAFAGIDNVDQLVLPSQIGYIGDDAFNTSFIKTLNIVSVSKIGNRAFQKCRDLHTVTFGSGTTSIGAQCFEDSGLTSLTLPSSVTTIGWGAFAKCSKMTELNLNNINRDCIVKEAAFYDCSALTSVSMDSSSIVKLGDAAFAVSGGASPVGIRLPQGISDKDGLGDHLFANRAALEYVVFPRSYGSISISAVEISSNMFHGCSGLQYVEFPIDIVSDRWACSYVNYDKDLFKDVGTDDFYVRGPETYPSRTTPADPRRSTWKATTYVNDFVPYVFKDSNGIDCYEVAMGGYRYQANEKEELRYCELVDPEEKPDGNIVIPAKVGNYDISSIATGCFADEGLRDTIETITIEDYSITSIGDSVFEGLPYLTQVVIGNSVEGIGDNAFAGCNSLVDVTFHTPLNGHENFTIGTDAFKIGSTGGASWKGELTFHGDIVEGYAPFEWAMNNVLDNINGIRICYKSLAPSYLTVMRDDHTGLVTLLDYPKYDQLDRILDDTHKVEIERFFPDEYVGEKTYNNMRQQMLYNQYLNGPTNETKREKFAADWKAAATLEEAEALYYGEYFGPWINPDFVSEENSDKFVAEGLDLEGYSNQDGVLARVADFFLEPITAYAMEEEEEPPKKEKGLPQAYYDVFPYSVLNNKEYNDLYHPLNTEELGLIEAAENINVPKGVDSIDVYGYLSAVENSNNSLLYHMAPKVSGETYDMYYLKRDTDKSGTKIAPGLFSGMYKDFGDEDDREEYDRGNDRIKSVTLNSVQYLPDYAFDSCEGLESVVLGPECKDIGTAPFRGCNSLTSVLGNEYYTESNCIVYSVNKDEDGSYTYTIEECLPIRGSDPSNPDIGGSSLPDGERDPNLANVSTIKPGAFEGCKNIGTVDLRNVMGLTRIPKDCFKNSTDLTRVYLPSTVAYIDSGAFAYDSKLTDLEIRGKEVFIAQDAFEHMDTKGTTFVKTYTDSSAKSYVNKYGSKDIYNLEWVDIGSQYKVVFMDFDGQVIRESLINVEPNYSYRLSADDIPPKPEREGYSFNKWLATNGKTTDDPITEDTVFVAQYYSTSGMVDGKYVVEFYDGVDGKLIDTRYAEPGGAVEAPNPPVHAGYTFLKWNDDLTNIDSNKMVIGLYSGGGNSVSGGGNVGGGTNPGGTTTGSGGTTTTGSGGTTTTGSAGATTTGSSGSTSNTSGSSTSATSTTSEAAGLYTLTVINGSGSGSYAAGTTVIISANTPATGQVFNKWTTETEGITFTNSTLSTTTITMPASNASVTAEFGTGSGAVPASAAGGTGIPVSSTNNGGTRVDITKPGISNKDLATATVNGSTDNFVVKISETPEATQAVANALTNKYGSLESILYYAMDISLYDSTGTTIIPDITGLTVDITIPIPDDLVVYGGNNMAGAVVSNQIATDQLEDLGVRFSTISGVPCVSFTATHFSPYTIYVDTSNLAAGMLDVTPKTGDPIHPKWFLSLGLACLSVILFIKKDKKVVLKNA